MMSMDPIPPSLKCSLPFSHAPWGFHGPGRHGDRRLPRVLVLGAGMAGLVTARILHDTGFPVQVLEARNRLGGRIWTVQDLGVPLDLGASWIHGLRGNPLAAWCRRSRIPIQRFPRGGVHFFEQGKAVSFFRLGIRGVRGLARCAFRYARLRRQGGAGTSPGSRSSQLADLFDPLIGDDRLPVLDRRLLLWLRTLEEAINGAPAHKVSISELVIPNPWTGNAVPIPGYGRLIQEAASGLSILFDCPVQRVALEDGGVTVETPRGIFRGDVAVVTFPIGVLSSRAVRFSPELPALKRRSLARIGYGGDAVLNKMAIRFHRLPCPGKMERLGRIPETAPNRVAFALWTHMAPVVDAPLLVGYTSGLEAARLDTSCGEEETFRKAHAALRAMFGSRLPHPAAWRHTRWLSDPWARGSYSYENGLSTRIDRLELAAPVAGRLFFAGEALHPEHYGTVHGALLSGEEAAREIHKRFCCRVADDPSAPWRAEHGTWR